MRKEIYHTIQTRLVDLQVNGELFPVHVGLWNEQLSSPEEEMSIALPAVLVEFDRVEWQQRSGAQHRQVGDQRITLHILINAMNDDVTNYILWGEEATALFDLNDAIIDRLVGVGGKQFSRLQHIASDPDHNHEQIIHLRETFGCGIVREAQKSENTIQDVTLKLIKPQNEEVD